MAAPSPWLVAADLFDPPKHPYATDPAGYAFDELGFHAWSKQREILEAVRDHPRVAVRSSHGPGKTAVAAQVALWFLGCFPNSRVISTAPTFAQVERLLWVEIRASIARAHLRGKGAAFPTPNKTSLEISEEWFALGLSTNEPERFQGHHADHLLLVVDEASGVDEGIFEAAEGFLTAEGAHILLVGNPTKIGGQFHRAFTTERAQWHQIHISTLDTPNYTGEPVPVDVARRLPRKGWLEEKARQWGVGSPMYQVRALGEFPSKGSNTIVALHEVEAAHRREQPGRPLRDELVIACDVARYGDDETVIAARMNREVRIRETYNGRDLVQTAGAIVHAIGEHPAHVVRIVIDDVGVGGGVTDILRHHAENRRASGQETWQIVPFNGGHRAFVEDEYPNRRSELWFAFADALPTLDLDDDEQLAADLTAPTYKLDSRGRRVVEPKDDTKKRLGRSPDRADAVLMTLVPAEAEVVTESPSPTLSVPPAEQHDWASAGANPLTERW